MLYVKLMTREIRRIGIPLVPCLAISVEYPRYLCGKKYIVL